MNAQASLQGHFEDIYTRSDDPYGARARFYEQRKRSVLLASLPRPRFRHAYEPGCGNAELTVALAQRCDRVLASDFSTAALTAAKVRTAGLANVQLARHALPVDWPSMERFDLVVLSEVGYFLPVKAIESIARGCAACLADDGVLVACDWLPDFDDRATRTAVVHGTLDSIGLSPLVVHTEDDFQLRIWARDPRSVAQREGIR
jgi:SAM-dependent methyltransferase